MKSFKSSCFNEPSLITKEMEDHFIDRTNKHINLVKKYITIVDGLNDIRFNSILDRVGIHDASKFNEPEFTPYVSITWSYYCKDNGIDFTIDPLIQKSMNKATIHHILSNRHHPEGHDSTFNPATMFNDNDRDSVPTNIVNGESMTNVDVAEMVCDWCAVSEERGNTPKSWADMNVNKRWGFTDEQTEMIYWLIDTIWIDK